VKTVLGDLAKIIDVANAPRTIVARLKRPVKPSQHSGRMETDDSFAHLGNVPRAPEDAVKLADASLEGHIVAHSEHLARAESPSLAMNWPRSCGSGAVTRARDNRQDVTLSRMAMRVGDGERLFWRGDRRPW